MPEQQWGQGSGQWPGQGGPGQGQPGPGQPGPGQPPIQGQPSTQGQPSGQVAKQAAGCGCAILALPFVIFLVVVGVALVLALPGSIVAAVLIEMARHGSGPLKDDGWVHGSLWQAFSGPVVVFGVSAYALIENWDTFFKRGNKPASPGPNDRLGR